MTKIIKKRLKKICSCCGKAIKVIVYSKKNYRGGHYFGKIPLVSKKEYAKAEKFGMDKFVFHGLEMRAYKKDPKPYSHFEYWECPKCYWRG